MNARQPPDDARNPSPLPLYRPGRWELAAGIGWRACKCLPRLLLALCVLPIDGLWAQGFGGLGRDTSGFSQVTPGRAFAFPQDHGAHPGFRTEWWYVTANLKDKAGVVYGAQWTLFRQAMEPGEEREGWRSQIAWMGHAAVTTANEHLFREIFARGGVGQAGVSEQPFRAWIDDWTLAAQSDQSLSMSAHGDGFRYALTLTSDKPAVLQGDGGFSRKSPQGQASYYYSQPFFKVDGVLLIHGKEIEVSGRAWMDREWTSQYLARIKPAGTGSPCISPAAKSSCCFA